MTREVFINKFVNILKKKFTLSETTAAEISLLLELMPNTEAESKIYYYPYYNYRWASSPYEDNKIYCTSDANASRNKSFVEESITGGKKLKDEEIINTFMESILS